MAGLIPHLYRGQLSGRVLVQGQDTRELPLWRLADHAGMVFQNPAAQMLCLSVEEEIAFGLENAGRPVEEISRKLEQALARFDLAELRARAPRSLSGGEQQKLALASVMAREPALLVLDEPFSTLDAGAAEALIDHLITLAAGGTAVVVFEHRGEYLANVPGLQRIYLNGGRSEPGGAGFMDREGLSLPAHAEAPRLEIKDVQVDMGGRNLLRNLNLAVLGGETVAIVGRNGVGKTTLLRAIAGLQAHRGSITVDGGAPALGMVFQNADLQLFNPSVREEILYRVPDPDWGLYRALLTLLGLEGYEGTPPMLLSEGEKRRVALATALMRKPRHGLMLDEPSLGQDQGHKARLMELARALNRKGQMVLMTTHDLSLAGQADRLALVGPEGFVAQGPPHEILRQPGHWERIDLHVPDWVHPSRVQGGR
jgi:energy-coupling factor transport system ATP-binding protein